MGRILRNTLRPRLLALLCLVSLPVSAGDAASGVAPGGVAAVPAPAPAGPAADHAAVLLPTVAFLADGSGGDLFDALQSSHLFAHLSREAPGSPIQLRIYHSVRPASVDAKNFFSGLLAVGTLGLVPVIMSGEHTMHYDLYVNGQRISRYEYSTKLSRNEYLNGKGADPTHGLGPDGVIWARSTADLFMKDLAKDDSVRALNEEYQAYFGASESTAGSSPAAQQR